MEVVIIANIFALFQIWVIPLSKKTSPGELVYGCTDISNVDSGQLCYWPKNKKGQTVSSGLNVRAALSV
jgi:hypothetical protein